MGLFVFTQGVPFIESRGWDDAAFSSDAVLEGGLIANGFGSGVKGSGSKTRVFGPKGNQSPLYDTQVSAIAIVVADDGDGL